MGRPFTVWPVMSPRRMLPTGGGMAASMLAEMATNCHGVVLGAAFRDSSVLWPPMKDMPVKCAASNSPWCPRTRLGGDIRAHKGVCVPLLWGTYPFEWMSLTARHEERLVRSGGSRIS